MPRAARRLAAVAPFPRDGVGQRPHARSDADSRALACRCPRFENREEHQVQGALGVRGQLFSVRPSQLGCGTARVHPYAGSVSLCSRLGLTQSEPIDLTLLATPSLTTTRVPTSRSRPTGRTRWRVRILPTRHPLSRAPNRSTRPTRPSCESDGQDRVSGPQRPPRAVRSTCPGTVLHPRDARSRASPFAERGLGQPATQPRPGQRGLFRSVRGKPVWFSRPPTSALGQRAVPWLHGRQNRSAHLSWTSLPHLPATATTSSLPMEASSPSERARTSGARREDSRWSSRASEWRSAAP